MENPLLVDHGQSEVYNQKKFISFTSRACYQATIDRVELLAEANGPVRPIRHLLEDSRQGIESVGRTEGGVLTLAQRQS
jgi:hypothetical protein